LIRIISLIAGDSRTWRRLIIRRLEAHCSDLPRWEFDRGFR
jgi:hypothetical protein